MKLEPFLVYPKYETRGSDRPAGPAARGAALLVAAIRAAVLPVGPSPGVADRPTIFIITGREAGIHKGAFYVLHNPRGRAGVASVRPAHNDGGSGCDSGRPLVSRTRRRRQPRGVVRSAAGTAAPLAPRFIAAVYRRSGSPECRRYGTNTRGIVGEWSASMVPSLRDSHPLPVIAYPMLKAWG